MPVRPGAFAGGTFLIDDYDGNWTVTRTGP